MATTLKATNCKRYNNGVSYSDESPLVGIHHTGNAVRVLRYTFTTPAEGASSFSLLISRCDDNPNGGNPALRFYVTTSEDSHMTAVGGSYAYDGTLTRRYVSGNEWNYEYYSETISKVLLPNTTYYLWVFPATNNVGTAFFPCDEYQYYTEYCSMTVDGGAGLVYIDNGSSLDAYQCYIDNGSSWDLCLPYIDTGTGWDMH